MNNFLKRTILTTIAGFISASLFAQTNEPPKGWHMLDRSSGFYGISVDKAYDFVKAKKLKSKTVIVAVIDSGVDTTPHGMRKLLRLS